MSSFVQETLSGIRVIKAYQREASRREQFVGVNQEYVRLNLSLARVRSFFMPMIMFLVGAVVLTVLWIGGHEVIRGAITLGEFVAFMVYLKMLIWPMLAFGWVISSRTVVRFGATISRTSLTGALGSIQAWPCRSMYSRM